MADAKKTIFPVAPIWVGTDGGVKSLEINSDELEREMYRQDLAGAVDGDAARVFMGIDLSSRIDETILSAFKVDGYANLTGQAFTKPMTATEIMEHNRSDNTVTVGPGTIITEELICRAMGLLARSNGPLGDYIWNDVYEEEMPAERPAFATQFSSMDKYPQYIEGPAGMTATLLSDDQEVFDESATMRHCLWRFYTMKIQRGEFIAYHIDTPNLFKHGFTCCFHRQEGLLRAGPRPENKVKIIGDWAIDQIRGKANSVSADPDLLAFAETILQAINGVE